MNVMILPTAMVDRIPATIWLRAETIFPGSLPDLSFPVQKPLESRRSRVRETPTALETNRKCLVSGHIQPREWQA